MATATTTTPRVRATLAARGEVGGGALHAEHEQLPDAGGSEGQHGDQRPEGDKDESK